eukprot:6192649-Pleurochrysis_carterae.AAC.2
MKRTSAFAFGRKEARTSRCVDRYVRALGWVSELLPSRIRVHTCASARACARLCLCGFVRAL